MSSSSNKPVAVPTHLRLLSGGVSGFASCVLLQPLDLIKTRIQQANAIPNTSLSYSSRTLTIARSVIQSKGVSGLWRGTTPTIIRNVPGVALYFYTLSEIRMMFAQMTSFAVPSISSRPSLTPSGDLIAGAVARTLVGLLLMPATVIKTRYESSLYQDKWYSQNSPFSVRDLFRGSVPTALRDAPYAGIFVLFYERIKMFIDTMNVNGKSSVPPAMRDALSGGIGSTLATFATAPFDKLKTNSQLYPDKYSSMLQGSRTILKERGLQGFFDGVMLRVIRKGASSAIAWTLYEGLVRHWAESNGENIK